MKSIFLGQMCFRDQVHIKVCFMSRFFTFDQCFNVCVWMCVCSDSHYAGSDCRTFIYFRCPVSWNAEPERLTDRVSVLEKKKGRKSMVCFHHSTQVSPPRAGLHPLGAFIHQWKWISVVPPAGTAILSRASLILDKRERKKDCELSQ